MALTASGRHSEEGIDLRFEFANGTATNLHYQLATSPKGQKTFLKCIEYPTTLSLIPEDIFPRYFEFEILKEESEAEHAAAMKLSSQPAVGGYRGPADGPAQPQP